MSDNINNDMNSAPKNTAADPKHVNGWCAAAHLSALLGIFCPVFYVLSPFAVLMLKGNSDPRIDYHAKESLNFQLTILLILFGIGSIALVGVGLMFLDFPTLAMTIIAGAALLGAGLYLIDLFFVFIAALSARNGSEYRYPVNLRLIK